LFFTQDRPARGDAAWMVIMSTVGFLLGKIALLLHIALQAYFWIIILRAALSWVNPDPFNPIVRFLHRATDPVLTRLRTIMPTQFGGIDFGPMIVLVVIMFLQRFVVGNLAQLAYTIR